MTKALGDGVVRALKVAQDLKVSRTGVRIALKRKLQEDLERNDTEYEESIVTAKEVGAKVSDIARALELSRQQVYNILGKRWPNWQEEATRNSTLDDLRRHLLDPDSDSDTEQYDEFSDFHKHPTLKNTYTFTWHISDYPRTYFLKPGGTSGFLDDTTSFPRSFASGQYGDYDELMQKAFNWVQSLDTKDSNEYLSELEAANESRE